MSFLRERLRARGHHVLRGGYEGEGTGVDSSGHDAVFGDGGASYGNPGYGTAATETRGYVPSDMSFRNGLGQVIDFMRDNPWAGALAGIPGVALNWADRQFGIGTSSGVPGAGTGAGNGFEGGMEGNETFLDILAAMNLSPGSGTGGSGSGSGSGASGAQGSANGLDDADWRFYTETFRPRMMGLWDTNTERGNHMYDRSMEVMNSQLGLAQNSANDYTNIVRPFIQRQADYVNQLGSPEYIAAQRAKAMEESQLANENAWAAAQRRMQGLGMNMNGGAAAAAQAAWAADAAKQKVAAAMRSDSDIFGKWGQGLADMNNYGLAMQKQSSNNASSALDWGKYGMTAGMTGFGAGLDLGKLNTATADASTRAVTNNRSVNNNYALGLRSADRQDDAANPWTTLAGGVLGSVGRAVGGRLGDAAGSWFGDLFGG